MFAFLFGLLGLGVVGAAAGGGGGGGDSDDGPDDRSGPARQMNTVVTPAIDDEPDNIFVEDEPEPDDDMTHDDGMDHSPEDDMAHDDGMDHSPEDDMAHDDGMDHSPEDDMARDDGMDHSPEDDMAHDDGMDHSAEDDMAHDDGMDHSPEDDMAHDDGMDHSPEDDMARDDGMDHSPEDDMARDDGMDHSPEDDMAHDDGMDHSPEDDMAHDDGMDHSTEDDMARDDGMDHSAEDDMAHDDGMDHSTDDDMAHDHSGDVVVLPQTQAEIDAFVAAVRAAPEGHMHDHGSSKAGEHMAAMDLVPRDEASHIAIANGDWDDPANWHNGEVPTGNAKVLIPEGVHMTYDHIGDASIFTVRVDGHLDFATDTDSELVVDTLVVSPTGKLTIGSVDDPVDPDVNVDIIFANNGPIDTNWDPMLLSRGMIAHGEVSIHGTEKDSHDKVIEDPMTGDTWVDLGETPEGWAVGDTIVIAGTTYEGYYNRTADEGYEPSQDEIRVITQIQDGMVFFDEPLVFDHDTPRDDLKTSVANYTRNVSFETEDAETAEIHERGHVMFMHNDDVDVRYAEFHELGRTDKSETALNVGEFDSIDSDTNIKGRYAFHFHRAGIDDIDDPAMAVGNAVYGSPGWGFVHHDSNAVLDNNASFDTFGAGYVAESGNETGAWNDNIAIFAQGQDWRGTKSGNDLDNFDLGQTGDGFWFQGRMVASTDNIAASVNHGFVYFHRGRHRRNTEHHVLR